MVAAMTEPRQEEPTTRWLAWSPLLIALYPVVDLYVTNFSGVELGDVILPLVAVLLAAGIITLAARRLCSPSEKATLLSSWVVAWLLSYGVFYRFCNLINHEALGRLPAARNGVVLPLWGIVFLSGIMLIIRGNKWTGPVNRFVGILSVCLLGLVGARCFTSDLGKQQAQTLGYSGFQVPNVSLEQPDTLPSIYYLVFDRYAAANTLQQIYDYDNSSFYEALVSRGFEIAEESQANYPRTILSMASALNCCYLPEESLADTSYQQLIEDHWVGRSLINLGYEYYHLGNGYEPFRTNKTAHYVYKVSWLPSEFAQAVYNTTPFSKAIRPNDKYQFIQDKFKFLSDLAESKKPRFTYAHFLVPHPPYIMDEHAARFTPTGSDKSDYVRQLRGTNKRILETLDALLEQSEVPPIIVLQADEGPYLRGENRSLSDRDKMLVRSRILTAFLLPKSKKRPAIPASISPVNTFRYIFRSYFDAEFDLLPDRTYYWEKADALGRPGRSNTRYVDVTSQVCD